MQKKKNFKNVTAKPNKTYCFWTKFISFVRKLFPSYSNNNDKKNIHSDDPFRNMLEEVMKGSDTMSEEEKEIFINFVKFGSNNIAKVGSKTIAKVMIPRGDVCGINLNSKKEDVMKFVSANGHTRTLVYEDTMDNILGFVHIKDLFTNIVQNKDFSLKKLTRRHLVAAPSMKLIDMLREMQKKKTHIAVIIDEYGGTDGIVTIEDIIEEIVGEIDDEHDAEGKPLETFRLINPKSALCNARIHIEELEEALSIKLKKQDDDCETIGGLVLARAGYFPKVGSKVIIDDNTYAEIIEGSNRSIKTIKLVVK